MAHQRGPHYAGKCSFNIVYGDPVTAGKSISKCVNCVTENTAQLKSLKDDFYQITMLTVLA